MWTIGSLDTQNSALVGALIVDFAIQLVHIGIPVRAFLTSARKSKITDSAVAMQAGWAVSAGFRTEKLYDGLGSSTFIACAIGTLIYAGHHFPRQVVATIFVTIWAGRLGCFLVFRVLKTGTDSRFDEVKSQPCNARRPQCVHVPPHRVLLACSLTSQRFCAQ